MISTDLVLALTEARRRTPRAIWHQLAAQLRTKEGSPRTTFIPEGTDLNRDAAWILSETLAKHPSPSWLEIAAVMTTVDCLVGDSAALTEIIWTGPANNRFPVRRVDQVLYDLISEARSRILLVTFAAHRIPHLCSHLSRAIQRGVELTLIVESEEESEGQLTRDAVAAFQNLPLDRARIYYWPLAQRERNASGRPGKLHVKCAVIDEVALIGSANLTDDAFNRNMELGMLIKITSTVNAIRTHFNELIQNGLLIELRQNIH